MWKERTVLFAEKEEEDDEEGWQNKDTLNKQPRLWFSFPRHTVWQTKLHYLSMDEWRYYYDTSEIAH